jgi:hypothetical protein
MSSSNNFYQKYNLSKAMDRFNNKIESKHAGGSKLFNHYRQFFDANVIEEFRRKNDSDNSYKGHKALILEIETYVQENVKFDSKEDYYNLVDTLKLLAENDV